MNIRKHVTFQMKDWSVSLLVFWGIMLTLNIVFQYLQKGFSFNFGNTHVSFNLMDALVELTKDDAHPITDVLFAPDINIVSIGIYILVAGIMCGTISFPLYRGLGISRVASWLSITISLLAISVFNTLVQTGISSIFAVILDNPDRLAKSLDIISIFQLITAYFLVGMLFFLIGTIFYCFGTWIGVLSVALAITALNFFPMGYELLILSNMGIEVAAYPFLISWLVIVGTFFLIGHFLYRARIK